MLCSTVLSCAVLFSSICCPIQEKQIRGKQAMKQLSDKMRDQRVQVADRVRKHVAAARILPKVVSSFFCFGWCCTAHGAQKLLTRAGGPLCSPMSLPSHAKWSWITCFSIAVRRMWPKSYVTCLKAAQAHKCMLCTENWPHKYKILVNACNCSIKHIDTHKRTPQGLAAHLNQRKASSWHAAMHSYSCCDS